MAHTDDTYRLAIFDCDFDQDLFLKSRIDNSIPPISSIASQEDVAASILGSNVLSSVPWANFAGLTIAHDMAVPNSLFSYSHNVKLSCQHEEIAFELFQKPSHAPPVDFLYSLPPMKNSINELWQAFGAFKWPETPLPRRMSVALMIDVGLISQNDIETCIDNSALKMSTDTRPLEDCPDCNFVPTGFDGCSKEECSIWHYSDNLGNRINSLSETFVEYASNECDLETFTNFSRDRLPQLYELLESSRTAKQSEAAMLSYTTIVNDVAYSACKDVFDSLYTTKSASVFMKGVRGCEDPTNMDDPCCNEAKLWSDCCLPEDKSIEIKGVFNATNIDAINAACGANSASVTSLLDSEISEVLISASHPEFGCSAAYDKVVPKNGDQDIYSLLWDESPVSSCEEEVRWGKTVTGLDICTSHDECWSGSCVSDGGSVKRCAQLYGEAIAGPLLSCISSRVDGTLWKYMAERLGIDPSKVRKGLDNKGSQWKNAVQKFTKLVGSPNCVGEEAEQGICAIIDITKEECLAINYKDEWSRLMEWVEDETNVNGGFCKKKYSHFGSIHIHGHTDDVQEECQAIFASMQGACINSSYFKSQSECTGENESWVDFTDHVIAGYRLVSMKVYALEEVSGNWKESVRLGEKEKCTLQTSCNWDPDNRITNGDRELCLDPSPLETTTYPQASFEEDGKHMTCLQCWGSRCEDFWYSSPSICAVSPHNHDDCAENSGGGPNNDQPVVMLDRDGHDSHIKCRRADLKTESECLPEFCPIASPEDMNPWEDMLHHCAESSCWDLNRNKDECNYDDTTEISFHWRPEYQSGNGACRVDYDHKEGKGFEERSSCESHGFMWWEGRSYRPGRFSTNETCTKYCNDGTWPPANTCSSGSCNEHCAQCVESNSWQFPEGAACYLRAGSVDREDCFGLDGYEWDWNTKLCYAESFSGDEAGCIDLDKSGSVDDDSLSLSMSMNIFDFYETDAAQQLLSLHHQYVSCPAQSESTCSSYCWSKDHHDYESCQENQGLEWNWALSRCQHSLWMVNTPSSPICDSYVAGLGVDAEDHERWERAEKCWSNGCHFEAGNVGENSPTCTGQPRGCAEQQGNTEWVDGGDESTSAGKILLGCRYDLWRSCATEESCISAGECEDWFIGNEGKCIVPYEPNEWGHRKGCHEIEHPVDGTRYDWADKLGCVARKKSQDGSITHVEQGECQAIGGTWHNRAKSQEQCEDNRGDVCAHPFDEWRVFGGIESEEKCDTCGYKTTPATTWRSGIWSESAETPLLWAERKFSAKNTWEEHSFDPEVFHALVRNSISRYVADAFKSKVYCELGAWNAFIPAVISMCHADGDNEQNIVKYDLTSSRISCGDITEQPPMETYEGSVSYDNAECTDSNEFFAETILGKVVSLTGTSGRRRTESSRVCSQHEIIKNSNNMVVGQKLGSGLSVTGPVGNVSLCIKPSVPDSEVCSNYTEFGISTVDDAGSFSVPLLTSTTINQQGEVCFNGGNSGVTYVPVKLQSGWATVIDTTTQVPTSSKSSTQSPTKMPIQTGSSMPSISSPRPSSHPTSSAVPSISVMPSGLGNTTTTVSPSIAPSIYPSKAPSESNGSVEVSFEVAVKLDGISDVSIGSLDSIVNVLKKVFMSMIPKGALIRLLKVGGYDVTRRLLRYLEEGDSSGIDVEFEVVMKKECSTAACDDSDAISSTLYSQVTTGLKAKVDDGEMARVIQEEAELEGVSELGNVTVSADSFMVSAAKITVEKVDVVEAEAPTEAPTPTDSASTAPIMTALVSALLASFFGMH